MKHNVYSLRGKVWLYHGDDPWHFFTIPKKDALDMQKEYIWPRRGFGAIPVMVTAGKTSWKTSIFPEKAGTYLLPIKKDVRKRESIYEGATISLTIKIQS